MKQDDAFAAALTEQLARRSLRQSDIASANGVTRTYMSKLMNTDTPSPEWVEIIANTLKASDEERRTLHQAAAARAGYKI